MATTTPVKKTEVKIQQGIREQYFLKTWFIFSWWVKLSTEKMGKDLVINTEENFDEIIVNGKPIKMFPNVS